MGLSLGTHPDAELMKHPGARIGLQAVGDGHSPAKADGREATTGMVGSSASVLCPVSFQAKQFSGFTAQAANPGN